MAGLKCFGLNVIVLIMLAVVLKNACANGFDAVVLHPAIPLVDENGQHVLDSGKPYSTRASCGGGSGGCHDIDKISNSYHFDMGRSESDDRYGIKRQVMPVVSPGFFGGYNCMLESNPLWLSKKSNAFSGEFLDFGAPGLIQTCASCHNGGGFAEKDRKGQRYDQTDVSTIANLDGDYFEYASSSSQTPTMWDWKKSGIVEPDCMMCHADFSRLQNNPETTKDGSIHCNGLDCAAEATSEWTALRANALLKKGHFRYANSALFKYLNISSDGNQSVFLLNDIGNLNQNTPPTLTWNPAAFDGNGKIKLPMLRFPDNKNCMTCHVTSHKRRGFYGFDQNATVELDQNGTPVDDYRDDVHKGKSWSENGETRTIENCNACHSKQYYKKAFLNVDLDADHNFPIGNADQDVRRDLNFQPGPLSCEHCHGGPAMGGAANPALPSGHSDILSAHRELWKANGDMTGYPLNTLNRVTQVHLDIVACQTCHIPNVQNGEDPINIRYRYRVGEDNRKKMAPYQTSPRYYWWDKTNQRLVSRRERIEAGDHDTPPQSYTEVKQLKTALDRILTSKGYTKVDTQMVWTESNDYLISHNTKPAVAAMPCDDCHTRRANGSVSPLVSPNGRLGEKNIRIVASMPSKGDYPRLIKEGLVRLDMPYFSVDSNGRIVENVSDILYETKIEPFNTALRTASQTAVAGEFQLLEKATAIEALGAGSDAVVTAAAASLASQKLYLFNHRVAADEIRNVEMLVGFNNASKNIVPAYMTELSVTKWRSLSQRVNKKTTRAIRNNNVKSGKLQAVVSSSLFKFSFKDQEGQRVGSLGGNRILIKLPYAGKAVATNMVDLWSIPMESDNILSTASATPVAAEIVSVKPGTTANWGYVVALVNELPRYGVLVDLKKKKP